MSIVVRFNPTNVDRAKYDETISRGSATYWAHWFLLAATRGACIQARSEHIVGTAHQVSVGGLDHLERGSHHPRKLERPAERQLRRFK